MVIGLASNILLAAYFGTGAEMDAYVVALVIPKTVAGLLIPSLAMLVIPAFINLSEKKGESVAWQFASCIFLLAGLVFSLLSVLLFYFAQPISELIAFGFNAEHKKLTATLVEIMAPVVAFSALSTLLVSYLQAMGRFAITVYSSILGSIIYLTLLYMLQPKYGIAGVALATSIQYGSILAFRLLFGLWKRLHLVNLGFKATAAHIKNLLKNAAILTVTTSVRRFNNPIEKYFATQTGSGSVSYIAYGGRLVNIIKKFYIRNVSKVMYPSIALHFAKGDTTKAMAEVILGARLNSFFILPLLAGIELLREPLVRLLFERGAFTAEDTINVSLVLFYGSLYLVQPMVQTLTSKALYSLKAIRFISLDAYLKFAMYISFILLLMPDYGFLGIILARALTLTWPLHFIYLQHRLGPFGILGFVYAFFRIILLSLLMWVSCRLWMSWATPESQISNDIFTLLSTPIVGVLIYLLGAWLFRFPEFILIIEKLNRSNKQKK